MCWFLDIWYKQPHKVLILWNQWFFFQEIINKIQIFHKSMAQNSKFNGWKKIVQWAERILNEIENSFNMTFVGWKSMLFGFWIYFAWNPSLTGIHRIHQLGNAADLAWIRSNLSKSAELPSWWILYPLN